MSERPLSYRDAGVDIDEAGRALRSVGEAIVATHDERVIAGLGAFGGLFDPKISAYERPLLVSSIDGVGTKTKVAAMTGNYSALGADLVNHCVNDILCQGARPLIFLDYFGCARLESDVFEQVVRSAADACLDNGCALIGGETAEMPGVYLDDEIDIVGSIVGIVEAEARLPRGVVQAGDRLIGLASSGLHTNGYSLARRALFEVGGLSVRDEVPGDTGSIGDVLLRPHRSYLRAVLPLVESMPELKAVAHITGGGLYDNLPRVLPEGVRAVIERSTWRPLPVFGLIQQTGNIPDSEMFRAFNMGIGMVLVVSPDGVDRALSELSAMGEPAAIIGRLEAGTRDVTIV